VISANGGMRIGVTGNPHGHHQQPEMRGCQDRCPTEPQSQAVCPRG
jgi:hypothetical protein